MSKRKNFKKQEILSQTIFAMKSRYPTQKDQTYVKNASKKEIIQRIKLTEKKIEGKEKKSTDHKQEFPEKRR